MHIGVEIFPTDQTIGAIELAREVEARGFESLWFPEHSHIPTRRATPWGGREGAPPLPEFYWRTFDPFVALGACAAVTTTLKLATGICLVAQRDPIHTAKEVASVDALSDGRFLFGVGYGWNKEEMAQHGTAYTERRAILRENLLAMKELWANDEASFDGELRADRAELVVAEADTAARPADHPRRRRRTEDRCAHRRVLRRLDADRGTPCPRQVG